MPEIIRQGDWGYGDTKGLEKNGLEPEGYGGKNRGSFNYGKKTSD